MYWKVNGVKQWNEQRDLRPDLRVYVQRESSEMCMHDRYKNTLPSVTQLVSMPHSNTEGTSRLEWHEHDCFSTDLDHWMVYAAFLVLLMLVWGYCVFWGIDVRTHTHTYTHTKQNKSSEILQQKNIWEHEYLLFLNTVLQLTENVHPWSIPSSLERSSLPPWWMRKANCFTHCALQNSEIWRSQCWYGSTQTRLLQTPMPTVCNRLTLFRDKTPLGWLAIFTLLHGSVQRIKMNTDGDFSSLAIMVASGTTDTGLLWK